MNTMQLLCLFPLASVAVLVGYFMRWLRQKKAAGERPQRSTIAWWAVVCALQAFLTLWAAIGLVSSQVWAPALEAVCATAVGILMLGRDRFFTRLSARKKPRRDHAWASVICLAGACVLSYVALEVPWNDWLIEMAPQFFLMENGLILLVMLVFFFLGQRHGGWVAPVVGACYAIGLAQFFVRNFKNAAILPSDVFALGTAAAVSGGYSFTIYEGPLVGASALLGAFLLLSLVRPLPQDATSSSEAAASAAEETVEETADKTTDDAQAPQEAAGEQDADEIAAGSAHETSGKSADEKAAAETANEAAVETSSKTPDSPATDSASKPAGKDADDDADTSSKKAGFAGRMAAHRSALLNVLYGIASAAVLVVCVCVPSYFNDLGLHMEYWYTTDWYMIQGFLPSFIAVAQDLPIPVPEGYTDEGADEILAEQAAAYDQDLRTGAASTRKVAENQFAEQKPNVICIMNETFSDLSKFEGLHAGYDGPQFFKYGLDDALSRGTLSVSVQGGGTCNTEFSFLTGNSMAFIGAGKYPYSLYQFNNVTSLASQFKAMGYQTTAMHPNYPSNWNRGTIYPQIGFDSFQSLEDFDGEERFHSGVTDEATYEHCLDLIESSDEPQFIFDVTMQNHGGYNKGDIPAEDLTDYSPSDYTSSTMDAQLNEYLSCIQKSDEALEELVNKLRELDEPTVLVFFGDHQPTFSVTYNDIIYADEDDQMVHTQRVYATDYVIWANYKVAGNNQVGQVDDTSVNYLGAMLCQIIGADMTDVQKAQIQARLAMPVLNLYGYKDTDGNWHETDTSVSYANSVARAAGRVEEAEITDEYADTEAAEAAAKAYQDLSWIQYRTFAEKVQ